MKAKFIYDLNDNDERMAALRCIKSDAVVNCLFQISYNLKRNMEAINDTRNISNQEILDALFENFSAILQDNDVNLDELTY